MKMPWTKRADAEQKRREDAEEKCAQVEGDWDKLRTHRSSIDREIEINDWTSTAITLFAGKEPN